MEKGTQKLYLFIVAAAALGIQVEKELADDGKISGFGEIVRIGSSAMQNIPNLIAAAPEAFEEAKDLTVVETVNIVLQLKQQKVFAEFSNAKIAKWAEAGLDLIQALNKFANTGKKETLQIGTVYSALQSIQKSEKEPIV